MASSATSNATDQAVTFESAFSFVLEKVDNGPAILQFVIPLLVGWTALFAVDFLVTSVVGAVAGKPQSKSKKQDVSEEHGVQEQHSGVIFGNGPIPINDTLALVLGAIMLIVLVPIVGGIVGLTVLWDFIDRAGQGRPQDGLVMSLARWFNRATAPLTGHFTRKFEDGFLVNVVLFLGVVIPGLMFWNLNNALLNGFSPIHCLAYHVFRIGPYFMNFAYCYVNCHKEGHSRVGLFRPGVVGFALKNVFNWWIGLFYGVLPSSFAYGHSINHHKYNNGPLDVVSTSDMPRDNFSNFVRFLPRWILYATNVSTIRQFLYEKEYKVAWKMLVGSLYYAIWVVAMYRLSPMFTFWYVFFPVGENVLLLACIQWCWHGFIDPENPENPFVGSITILGGPINVQGEDFHTVHHQYPGAHWTQHSDKYEKHKNEYEATAGSTFSNTHAFEMFFLIILRKYREMAEKYTDMSGKYQTIEEKEELIKTRLRTCWWGPHAKKAYLQHGWEGVEDSNGFSDSSAE